MIKQLIVSGALLLQATPTTAQVPAIARYRTALMAPLANDSIALCKYHSPAGRIYSVEEFIQALKAKGYDSGELLIGLNICMAYAHGQKSKS